MDRRFIDRDNWDQAFRKLESRLKVLWMYMWKEADACGVYSYDPDYLALETCEKYLADDFEAFGDKLVKIAPGKFLFIDFIEVNYGTLRENYNPHKPVFRDLKKNKLQINSSLNQACFKLEEEDEYKDEEEGKEETGAKIEIFYPFNSEKFIEAWAIWMDYRKEIKKPYKSKKSEQAALKQLSEFDEEFSIKLIENSIAGGYQGLVFPNTMADYLKQKNNGKQAGKNQGNLGGQVDDLITAKYGKRTG